MYAGSSMSQPRTIAVAAGLAVLSFPVGAYVSASINRTYPGALGVLAGLYCLLAIKVADQWQKVAVLRLGRYVGLRGPGLFFIVPFVDRLSTFVDQRVRVATVTAESTLTRDTVPVNVDAIIFWVV